MITHPHARLSILIISSNGGKLHFNAPVGAIVEDSERPVSSHGRINGSVEFLSIKGFNEQQSKDVPTVSTVMLKQNTQSILYRLSRLLRRLRTRPTLRGWLRSWTPQLLKQLVKLPRRLRPNQQRKLRRKLSLQPKGKLREIKLGVPRQGVVRRKLLPRTNCSCVSKVSQSDYEGIKSFKNWTFKRN